MFTENHVTSGANDVTTRECETLRATSDENPGRYYYHYHIRVYICMYIPTCYPHVSVNVKKSILSKGGRLHVVASQRCMRGDCRRSRANALITCTTPYRRHRVHATLITAFTDPLLARCFPALFTAKRIFRVVVYSYSALKITSNKFKQDCNNNRPPMSI